MNTDRSEDLDRRKLLGLIRSGNTDRAKELIKRDPVIMGAISIARLGLLQWVVMLILSAILYTSPAIAGLIYKHFGPLQNYLPILWRYHRFFESAGKASDFPILLSIALLNIVVQPVFLFIIICLLHGKLSVITTEYFSTKTNFVVGLFIVGALSPNVELFTGPYDLGSIWLHYSGAPPVVSSIPVYFRYCLILPAANILLGIMILARFPAAYPRS